MKGKKPPEPIKPKARKERVVTPDEASLWAQVTSTIGPAKGKPRVRDVSPSPDAGADVAARPPPLGEPKVPRRAASSAAREKPKAAKPAPPPPKAKVPPIAEFDRRKVRHIASGKIEIDARLDLHGLRQSEARHRLLGFIHSAHQRGLRTVLVITGKGTGASADPLAGALGEPQRGVLRRLVPQWLDGPELRALIVSFTMAGARHGGEGALYVRLRRADRVTFA